MSHWERVHEKLGNAIQRLMNLCNEEIGAILEKKLLFINRRWKELIDFGKQFDRDQSMKKKREEFFAASTNILETLEKIDQEIQQRLPCVLKTLKDQENRLYVSGISRLFFLHVFLSLVQKVQSGLDSIGLNIDALGKLSQAIGRESVDPSSTNDLNNIIRSCLETFRRVQELLPAVLKRNKMMLGHLQKFEEGLTQCQQWFNEARQILNRYSIQIPMKRIEEFLEQHRVKSVFFCADLRVWGLIFSS